MKRYSERDLESMYDDMLDEVFGVVTIGNLEYSTSRALRLVDPTAYRCGFADWLDAEMSDGRIFETADGEYCDEEQTDENDEIEDV